MFGGKSLPAKIFGAPYYISRDLILPHVSRFRQSRSGHLLAVEINSWVGLFAHMEWFLEISLHCEQHDLTPCFMSTSPQYVNPEYGPDWFEYFFVNRQLSAEDSARINTGEVPICRIEGIRHLGLPVNYDLQLSLNTAGDLVRKYIGIRSEMLEKVNQFVDGHFTGKCVLGIHYRGTDKTPAEAPPVSYSEIRESIREFLEAHREFDCLFVASDEMRFVEFVQQAFGDALPVFAHDDRERSRGDVAIHRSKQGDAYRKAEEAVLNCLLLSKCNTLIKTASMLSAWSKLFNPDLPVILLNPPFDAQLWFPDRALVS